VNLHVCLLDARHRNSESLKLSSRQLGYFAIEDIVQFKFIAHFLFVIEFQLGIQHLGHRQVPLDCTWYVINVLRFDECLEVILQDFGEVVLKLGSPEVLQNFLPIGRVLGKCRERVWDAETEFD
jgi:hypothetical protein